MIVYKKPCVEDVDSIFLILQKEVEKGLVLFKSKEDILKDIRSYFVAKDGDRVVGFCALRIYTQDLAEIRSLVVDEAYRKQGIAKKLILHNLQEGEELGIKSFLVLTYRPNLFKLLGFKEIQKDEVPHQKIWADCVVCKNFPVCQEIALLKTL
ncbi:MULTISPECIES: N-acetyltransferase [unclassified Helicobacter]|uniref:N-acetyltransferase n=1 Tax=unclassified Helicobacter TaxID=2593540 RepID=UPI000CF0E31C|nr:MULTISPECIES: N-acetyltransferase [unclassified Helicobacter]